MVIKCTSGLFCRTALSIFSNGFILQPSFPHRRDVLQAHDPAIWGRFHQTSATGSRTPARTAETRRPTRAFPAPFFRAGNLAFRREASHDLAIMSMPFTPPYATEKAWALPVRHPCCPDHSGHTPWAFHCREPITFRRDASPRFTGRPPFSSPYFPLYKGIFPQAPFSPKQD